MLRSVRMHVVAADGLSAVLASLVSDGVTDTVSVAVVTPASVWSGLVEGLPARAPRGVDGDLAVYEQPSPASATFTRRGARGAVAGANVIAAVMAARTPEPTVGPARGVAGVDVSLVDVLLDRGDVVVGAVRAEVRVPDDELTIEAVGSFQEQEVERLPCVELGIAGQHLVAGAVDGTGWIRSGGSTGEAPSVAVDPMADDRAVTFTTADATVLEGRLATVRRWPQLVDGREVTTSLVVGVVGGAAVSGWVIDRT